MIVSDTDRRIKFKTLLYVHNNKNNNNDGNSNNINKLKAIEKNIPTNLKWEAKN